jgi:UDP-N-acetylmuramoylalanine--D-glutamate ligase
VRIIWIVTSIWKNISTVDGIEYLVFGKTVLMRVNEVKISGRHNTANALAALAIGQALEFPMDAMLSTLREFKGLPHRCEFIREHGGVKWFNDSKGTNVGATAAALEGLGTHCHGKVILLAGGVGKGADFSPLRSLLKKYVRKVILFGEAAKQMEQVFQGVTEVEQVKTFEAAVNAADLAAIRGDIVLLSPACASYDMFRDFEHRGQQFSELVREL